MLQISADNHIKEDGYKEYLLVYEGTYTIPIYVSGEILYPFLVLLYLVHILLVSS